jgi:hypothetical protein
MKLDIFLRNAKKIDFLLPKHVKNWLIEKHQKFVFYRAIREFSDNFQDLNSNDQLVNRLIYGWGNSGFSVLIEYTKALVGHAYHTNGPILECGSGLSKEQWILNHIEILKQLSLNNPYDNNLKEKLAGYYLAHFNYELRVKKSVKINLDPVCCFYHTEPGILKKIKTSLILIPYYLTKYWIPNLLRTF